MKKSKFKIVFVLVVIISIFYFGMVLINSYFSWYGYGQWKDRRGTYGNRNESLERKVFVKDLEFKTNLDLQNFNVYIEKGYKFGCNDTKDTRIVRNSKYPYQVSLNKLDNIKKVVYNVVNFSEFDSIDNDILNISVYLDKPYLKDTIILKITRSAFRQYLFLSY